MYTDDDLNGAIDKGIFTSQAVDQFRQHMATIKNTSSVDEENFRLITGFNDVFVVIASVLMLGSTAWLFSMVNNSLAAAVFAFYSNNGRKWGSNPYLPWNKKPGEKTAADVAEKMDPDKGGNGG